MGQLVRVPQWGNVTKPGVIVRRYKARYDSVGWHWRYSVLYLKRDFSEPKRRKTYADLRAVSFNALEPEEVLEVLAKLK